MPCSMLKLEPLCFYMHVPTTQLVLILPLTNGKNWPGFLLRENCSHFSTLPIKVMLQEIWKEMLNQSESLWNMDCKCWLFKALPKTSDFTVRELEPYLLSRDPKKLLKKCLVRLD